MKSEKAKPDGYWGDEDELYEGEGYSSVSIPGELTYSALQGAYDKATFGSAEPNYIVMSAKTYAAIKAKFTAQQVFVGTEPGIGFMGLKFNKATMLWNDMVADDEIQLWRASPVKLP